jgi:hypothetical protein
MASATINVAAMHRGKPHVELAEHAPGVMWLAGRLRQLNEKHPGAKFAAWAAGPVKAWKPTLAEPYSVQRPNGETEMLPGFELELLNTTDASAACAYLESLIGDGGATHSPDQIYVESLKGAEIRALDGGSWVWNWKASTSDLAPIAGAGGALWLLARDDVIIIDGNLMA